MAEVYNQAAVRHFMDAQLLEHGERYANADQLYGFAAECALKWVCSGLPGANVERLHIDKFWSRVRLHRMNASYKNLSSLLSGSTPFSNWSVDQRYDGDGSVSYEIMEAHRLAAQSVLKCVGLLGRGRRI